MARIVTSQSLACCGDAGLSALLVARAKTSKHEAKVAGWADLSLNA